MANIDARSIAPLSQYHSDAQLPSSAQDHHLRQQPVWSPPLLEGVGGLPVAHRLRPEHMAGHMVPARHIHSGLLEAKLVHDSLGDGIPDEARPLPTTKVFNPCRPRNPCQNTDKYCAALCCQSHDSHVWGSLVTHRTPGHQSAAAASGPRSRRNDRPHRGRPWRRPRHQPPIKGLAVSTTPVAAGSRNGARPFSTSASGSTMRRQKPGPTIGIVHRQVERGQPVGLPWLT